MTAFNPFPWPVANPWTVPKISPMNNTRTKPEGDNPGHCSWCGKLIDPANSASDWFDNEYCQQNWIQYNLEH